MTGYVDGDRFFEKGVATIVRKYGNNVKTSVQRDFEDAITEYNLWDYLEVNKTDRTYKYEGRTVEFIGVDEPQKARGPRRDLLYCNEANEITPEDFFQLMIRTKYKCFLDWNPDDEDVWINQELEIRRMHEEGDVELIVSTYRDNPFLDPQIVKEIERLERTDPQYWKIYGLGEYGKLEGLIFSFTDIDKVPEGAKFIDYGQDFGYTNDPSAFVGVYLWNNCLILDEVFYETGLGNRDIAKKYETNAVPKYAEIFADSSEPKSIDELCGYGYNVKSVEKGPDSIRYGIDCMTQYPIYVTSRSVNLRKEMKKYTWAKDKNGKSLNVPVDIFNHAIDAARYGVMSKLKMKKKAEAYVLSF